MSSCLSGGGRAYGFNLEIMKSPSSTSSTITAHSSSSPTSSTTTLSESSNSPLVLISTRKPRTPRKRPNQTYNEAAALLSTAYPKVFSAKHLTKPPPGKFSAKTLLDSSFLISSATDQSATDLLLPLQVFGNSGGFLPHQPVRIPEKPHSRIEPSVVNCWEKPCQSPVEINSSNCFYNGWYQEEDFDTESILDYEEIEEGHRGIDSIMGNQSAGNNHDSVVNESSVAASSTTSSGQSCSTVVSTCYGFPMGLGFDQRSWDFHFGMKRGTVRALRNVDGDGDGDGGDGGEDWWKFPSTTVDVLDISPKLLNKAAAAAPTGEKKKKKIEKPTELLLKDLFDEESPKEKEKDKEVKAIIPKSNLLKLNYEQVVKAWSDRGSPFSEEFPGQNEQSGNGLHARLAEIDLFSENGSGGVREASVLRYKEKRRTRLFSKKIRYQVRKVNADRRPRMKGRFVRRPNSPMSEGG